MTARAKRWILFGAFLMAVATTAAGVMVLRAEFGSGAESSASGPGPGEVAWDFLLAVDRRDPVAASRLTDRPEVADAGLRGVFKGLPVTKVATRLGEVEADGDVATAEFDVTWTLSGERRWSYTSALKLRRIDGRWWVRWTPTVVHPKLAEGQRLKLIRSSSEGPAVVDADGEPLLVWRSGWARAASEGRAGALLGAMAQLVEQRPGQRGSWSVVVVDEAGKRVRTVHGRAAKTRPPLVATVRARVQDAADRAIEAGPGRAVLVVIEPSTGGILAVAQGPGASPKAALSGLFPPGSTFKIATATAALRRGLRPDSSVSCPGTDTIGTRTIRNDDGFDLDEVPLRTAFARSCNTTFARIAGEAGADELANAASSLGLNADFDIPGLTTEAGVAGSTADRALRVEQGIGQGDVRASPFGVALMSATVASGRAVTPKLWRDLDTSVNTGYAAPSAAETAALRTMMRAVVTSGTGGALIGFGAVHGKTGTAEVDGDAAHGWFTGYRGDMAFAVLVENAGSSASAVRVAAQFLQGL